MPRINSIGRIGSGIGDDGVTISWFEGAEVRSHPVRARGAGQTAWLRDDRLIFQEGAQLFTCNVDGNDVQPYSSLGANELAAGGDVALFNFGNVLYAFRGGREDWRLAGGFVGDVAIDGSFVPKTPDGLIAGLRLAEVQALPGGAWSGLDPDWRPVASPGVAPVVTPAGWSIYGLRRFGDFCCYLMGQGGPGQFVVSYCDRPVGKVLASGLMAAHRPDVRLVDQWLVSAFATGSGEANGTIRGWALSPSELTESLGAPATPPIVVRPPVVTPPVVPPPVVKPPSTGGTVQPSQDWKTFHYLLTNPRIADYRETAYIARIFQDGRGLHVLHSKQGEWPKVISPGNPDVKKGDDITYTAFVHRFVDGAWWVYPLALEWHNGPGETSDTERLERWYGTSLYGIAGPVYAAGPIRDRELLGFSVVHGMQRGELGNMEISGTLHERSNVQYLEAQLAGDFDHSYPAPTEQPPAEQPPASGGDTGTGQTGGGVSQPPAEQYAALVAAVQGLDQTYRTEAERLRASFDASVKDLIVQVRAELKAGIKVRI
jgi:hypothetical protein